jgi:hypothetical protein
MSKGKHDTPQDGAESKVESRIKSVRKETGTVSEVSEGRRRFTKAGLLVPPILMSVASRPVLGGGVNCLSNALSGNLSNPDRGLCKNDYYVDWTDADNWSTNWPQGTVMGCDDLGDISPKPDSLNGDGENFPAGCAQCQSGNSGNWNEQFCSDGTPFNAVFCTSGEGRSMYRILCQEPDSDEAACVKALL